MEQAGNSVSISRRCVNQGHAGRSNVPVNFGDFRRAIDGSDEFCPKGIGQGQCLACFGGRDRQVARDVDHGYSAECLQFDMWTGRSTGDLFFEAYLEGYT